jgi:phosphoribosylamine--glycine ligase
MRILIVGSGGREHALLWKLVRDAPDASFFCTGGNAGMEDTAEAADLQPTDVAGLLTFARERAIDLTVVGPEAALAAGIVDAFAAAELPIFGPRRAAAEIESSKAFAKAFMRRHAIPTAGFRTFTDTRAAESFLRAGEGSVVVKASGLLGGKGVVVCEERGEALRVAGEMLGGAYGEAGREIVVEERLEGRELSVIALTDGEAVRPLLPARDHKRVFDGDRGPNTGGMGAVVPVPDASTALLEEVAERILRPAVRGLAAEGRPFRGALYAGLMLTREGPRVIEFNARFGDPETQALLPLLESSLLELLWACAEPTGAALPPHGRGGGTQPGDRPQLRELELRWRPAAACCVVAAAEGYPGSYARGIPIDLGSESPRALVFHAGTGRAGGRLVTSGGRVLAVTGLGADPERARAAAYERLSRISFEGMHYRRDIGTAPDA